MPIRVIHGCNLQPQMNRQPPPRKSPLLAVAVGCIIVLGLFSRAFPPLVPAALGKYPGDALWALMVQFGIAFLRPELRPSRVATLALGVSWLVELSQLYQAPWINALRATRLGHLALGSQFHWPDLLAYTLGVSAGLLLDARFCYRHPGPAKSNNTAHSSSLVSYASPGEASSDPSSH